MDCPCHRPLTPDRPFNPPWCTYCIEEAEKEAVAKKLTARSYWMAALLGKRKTLLRDAALSKEEVYFDYVNYLHEEQFLPHTVVAPAVFWRRIRELHPGIIDRRPGPRGAATRVVVLGDYPPFDYRNLHDFPIRESTLAANRRLKAENLRLREKMFEEGVLAPPAPTVDRFDPNVEELDRYKFVRSDGNGHNIKLESEKVMFRDFAEAQTYAEKTFGPCVLAKLDW